MKDRVGQQLGNYRLNSLIGRGGFGEVYLAEHIHLETLAAIKLLDMQLASTEAEHFRTEARVIARLIHPNIIRVLDYGIDDLTPYLVMDFAPNGTLRQRHPKESRVAIDTVISYVKQIAQALQFAHEKQVIHRDVKPQNMLIGQNDEILLSDFGIAVTGSSTASRSVQDMSGTPLYMAPEQINGRPSRASDQYSLGIVVYEWLSGFPPFQGSLSEITLQHTSATPPSLRAKVPSIAPAIEQVVLKALAKDIHQRFPSVQEFAGVLEEAVIQSDASDETLRFVKSSIEIIYGEKQLEIGKTDYGSPASSSDTIPSSEYPEISLALLPPPWNTNPWETPVPPKWEISKEDIPTISSTIPGQIPYSPDSASTGTFQSSVPSESELQDSFILYHRADRQWAEWIAWQLHIERYSTILPVWGVLPSTDIELELRKAAAKANRTIILLSPNFFRTFAVRPDWIAPLKRDAVSQHNKVIAVYIRDFRGKHKSHLESIHYIDLTREEEATARKILLEAMRGEYIAPDVAPTYPGRPRRQTSHDKTESNKKRY